MSWNFPQNTFERLHVIEECLNLLKGEIERLWKQQSPTPENGLGIPFGAPLSRGVIELPFIPDPPGVNGEDGEENESRNFVLGKSAALIDRFNASPVQIWYFDGSSHVADPAEPSIEVYSMFADIPANKFIGCCKDAKTGVWYAIAAECG